MFKPLSLQRVLCFSITCFLYVCCSGQSARNVPGNGSALTAQKTHSDSGRFFFGTSQEKNAKHCASAWLLYLDKDGDSGEIFVLASMEKFTKFELGKDGTLVLQWSGLGDKNYQLNGTFKSDELAGDIQLVDVRSGNSEYLCEITATELPPQNSHTNPSPLVSPSRFSNTHYVNESGDLIGVDIRIFSTDKGAQGMIVFYEGYWDEPVDTPLALSQIKMNKGSIQFATETPSAVAHYHLLLTSAGGLLYRDDVQREKGDKGVRLRKKQKVLPAIIY